MANRLIRTNVKNALWIFTNKNILDPFKIGVLSFSYFCVNKDSIWKNL